MEISAQLEKEIDERITHYPVSKRSAVLPVLHALQHELGYISEESVEWTAKKLDLEPIKVLEVVTFYPGFRQTAPGKYHIRVCRTLSCAMAGSGELMEELCKKADIDRSERQPSQPDRRQQGRHLQHRVCRVPRQLRHRSGLPGE